MTKPRNVWHAPAREERRSERRHDPYEATRKPADPCRCPDCGAVFHDGRWTWGDAPEGAAVHACPACRRIRESLPAGTVRLGGPFLAEHRDEILALVRHCESREKAEHPLNRIMAIADAGGEVEVTTTDVHLAGAIGAALSHAYHGTLERRYGDDDTSVRVRWTR